MAFDTRATRVAALGFGIPGLFSPSVNADSDKSQTWRWSTLASYFPTSDTGVTGGCWAAGQIYVPGFREAEVYNPGFQKGQRNC